MNSCPLYTALYYVHYSFNEENETALYKQWFVIYRCPLRQAWLYIYIYYLQLVIILFYVILKINRNKFLSYIDTFLDVAGPDYLNNW